MTPESIQLWLQIGVGGLLLVALFLGSKGKWVFGRTFEAMEVDRNEWKALALRLLPLAEKSANVADAVIKKNGTP